MKWGLYIADSDGERRVGTVGLAGDRLVFDPGTEWLKDVAIGEIVPSKEPRKWAHALPWLHGDLNWVVPEDAEALNAMAVAQRAADAGLRPDEAL